MENPLRDLSPTDVNTLAELLIASQCSLRVLKLGALLAHRTVEFALSTLKRLRSLDLLLDGKFVAGGHLRRPGALPALEHLRVGYP